ncbi:MAG TPA: hypothetical protein PKA05_10525 [Roseiflexaceae bacterium]|nr:hypothetical protein [Roseiflexaceae bacterium]
MNPVRQRFVSVLATAIMGLMIFSCGAIGMTSADRPAIGARAAAAQRWETRTFSSYTITLRAEIRGLVCTQQLEVNNNRVLRVISNTCQAAWLDHMTVEQLFALGDEVAAIPAARCFPSVRNCPCERVFTRREIFYHAEFGFPEMIMARSEMRPSWSSADYWRWAWEQREAPACSGGLRRLTFQVLAFTPIE